MDKKEKKKQEKEFRDFFLFSSLSYMKTGMLVTLALFVMFRLVTLILFGDSEFNTYFLRFGVIIPVIVATLIVLYIKKLQKWLHTLLTIFTMVSVAAVFWVGATSDYNDPGYPYYRVWVMVVIMGTFVFYRIRLRSLLIIGGSLMLSYILACMFNHFISDNPQHFAVSLFFIVASESLGFFIAVNRSKSIHEIFMQKKELDAQNQRLINEIIKKKRSEKALKESGKHYRELINALPDLVYVLNRDLQFIMVNKSLNKKNKRAGITGDITGKHITEVYPFITSERIRELEDVFRMGKGFIRESSQMVFGKLSHTEIRSIPVFRDHETIQVMVIVRDISQKIEVEQLKQANLMQKEVLLREIHHRVKNNLSIVISLLDMQIRNNPNEEFVALSREIEYRIRSMVLIHEHLYKSEELDRVPLEKYLVAISNGIARSFACHHVRTVFNCDSLDVKIELAMPLGMIVNEILTNACKYAFPDKREGEITIDLKREANGTGSYRLSIRDNGIGLPENFSFDNQTSLGMFIIKLLSEQISADLNIENHQGTSFSLVFNNLPAGNQTLRQ